MEPISSFSQKQILTITERQDANSCAAHHCTECCRDMILNMTMQEFDAFLGPDTYTEWVPSLERLQEEATNDTPGIFYFAELKVPPRSLSTKYKPLELFRNTGKGPNRPVAVLINGFCHNLDRETGNCTTYQSRSGACREYKENWPHCIPEHSFPDSSQY